MQEQKQEQEEEQKQEEEHEQAQEQKQEDLGIMEHESYFNRPWLMGEDDAPGEVRQGQEQEQELVDHRG